MLALLFSKPTAKLSYGVMYVGNPLLKLQLEALTASTPIATKTGSAVQAWHTLPMKRR